MVGMVRGLGRALALITRHKGESEVAGSPHRAILAPCRAALRTGHAHVVGRLARRATSHTFSYDAGTHKHIKHLLPRSAARAFNRTSRPSPAIVRTLVRMAAPQAWSLLFPPMMAAFSHSAPRVEPRAAIQATRQLASAIEAIDPSAASGPEWLRVRRILSAHGQLTPALVARRHACESARAIAHARRADTDALLVAALLESDAGNHEASRALLERVQASSVALPSWVLDLEAVNALVSGDRERFVSLARWRRKSSDERMLETVRSRSVAIVGPAPSAGLDGRIIDRHDVVARMVYTGPDRIGEPERAGSRTDIAYYARQGYLRGVLPQHGPRVALPEDLPFAVVAARPERFIGTHVRVGFAPALPIVFGIGTNKYHKLQFSCYDLLHLEPAAIHVYGATHYLGRDLYRPGYFSSRVTESSAIDLCAQFSRHDPVGNLRFIRHLVRNDWISGDADHDHVVNMTDYTYSEGLERLFGATRDC